MSDTRIILFGASVHAGFWDPRGGWFARIREEVNRKGLEKGNRSYQFYNCSVSGHTTEDLAERVETELGTRTRTGKRDIAIVGIGVNDTLRDLKTGERELSAHESRKNFSHILDVVREEADDVLVITGPSLDFERTDPLEYDKNIAYRQDDYLELKQIQREITESKELSVLDVDQQLDQNEYVSTLVDGVHPGPEGHEMLKEAINPWLEENDIVPDNI